jgi:hypothetical protein
MRVPDVCSQAFQIVFDHFEGELLIARMAPAIAREAADEQFAMMVEFISGEPQEGQVST